MKNLNIKIIYKKTKKTEMFIIIYNSKLNFEYKNGEKIISFKNNNNIDEL